MNLITSVNYERRRLVVAFHHGAVYAHPDVPPMAYQKLMTAPSLSQFYYQHVVPAYPATRIDGTCQQCGSAQELIGQLCRACGTGTVGPHPADTAERYPGEADVQQQLKDFRGIE